LRPGLPTTAKIRTAEKKSVIAIPIQALAVRSRKVWTKRRKTGRNRARRLRWRHRRRLRLVIPRKDEIQGVFVIMAGRQYSAPWKRGFPGVTDIEITKGLQPGDDRGGQLQGLRTL